MLLIPEEYNYTKENTKYSSWAHEIVNAIMHKYTCVHIYVCVSTHPQICTRANV